MAFEMYQDVILTADLPEHDLCIGDVGTVVEHHSPADREEGYSVEFFDMTGRTIATATIAARNLRAPSTTDFPSVREFPRQTG